MNFRSGRETVPYADKMTGSREKPQAVTWILRIMAALLAMYGLYLFGRKDIFSYMFLKQQFVFFDFEQSAAAVFVEYEESDHKTGTVPPDNLAVNSFSPNAWGLYNMHGNVGEWVWDYYGDYGTDAVTDPIGAETGTLRVYRGGGWNDYSWGGNTKGIAEEIQSQTGANLFEIELVNPYSNDYNTVLDEAQRDQNEQARPELANHVEDMEEYDIIILGYPKMEYGFNCVLCA